MRADRLAFRPRRAFARAAVEFGQHLLVRHGGRLHIADTRAHAPSGLADLARTMPQRLRAFNGRHSGMAGLPRKSVVKAARSGYGLGRGQGPARPQGQQVIAGAANGGNGWTTYASVFRTCMSF